MSPDTRELTLKERMTEDLKSRIGDIYAGYAEDIAPILNLEDRIEVEAIEAELEERLAAWPEERAEWEQKANKW